LGWSSRDEGGRWQPAYAVPLPSGGVFSIPDTQRGIEAQRSQVVLVDVSVPESAPAGSYSGSIAVEADGAGKVALPVRLDVFDFALPDECRFRVELNAYAVPGPLLDYQRLVHDHRLTFNPWRLEPKVSGRGKAAVVEWKDYDRLAGPLLSGEAFRGSRRAGVPLPCMYLPFADDWPCPLTRETYAYPGRWPGRGEGRDAIDEHYASAPYLGDGLSPEYKETFLAVEEQFVAHFRERGWTRTEMQCFFGGKATHRIEFGANRWWTTDEPYHWPDWLACQFFGGLWCEGRRAAGADPARWAVRFDISRPMWQGRVLDGIADVVYYGGFAGARAYRRCRDLARDTGVRVMTYGSVSRTGASNVDCATMLADIWLHGGDGALPWQTLGNDGSLDRNENVDGAALLVPGGRFRRPVVADLRVKALREGEELGEYLAILADRRYLSREQIAAAIAKVAPTHAERAAGASADDADALRFGGWKAWQLVELKRAIAERIEGR
ncbi:MAG TPA: hypothetical protein VHF22_11425, partial [Planctomycetota bacterium]|nr:hypothetical protein [Planctomycetota bacterium]